jgi:hypothetical protein
MHPISDNVLRASEVFYFGLFGALSFVKNIAIKINKLLTEIYIAIFLLAGTLSEVMSY